MYKNQPKIFFFFKESKSSNNVFSNQIASINNNKFIKNFYFYKKNKGINHPQNSFFINYEYPEHYNFSFDKILYFYTNIAKTVAILNKEKPASVFAGDIYSFMLLSTYLMFFKKNEIKLVYLAEINVYESLKRRGFFYKYILYYFIAYLIRNAYKIIFLSRDLAEFTIKKFNIDPKKAEIIPYSVDFEMMKISKKRTIYKKDRRQLESKSFKIFSIGRLNRQKDFFTILKAFSLVSSKIKNVELFVIGDGDQKDKILNSDEYQKLEDKIHMLGWKNNIFPYLKFANLFLFSSFYEGFGLILVEVMANKVPIIATDSLYGPSEILEKGRDGVLVPVGDYKKMAREIERFIEDKKLKNKYVKNGTLRAKSFSLSNMLADYEKLFNRL